MIALRLYLFSHYTSTASKAIKPKMQLRRKENKNEGNGIEKNKPKSEKFLGRSHSAKKTLKGVVPFCLSSTFASMKNLV